MGRLKNHNRIMVLGTAANVNGELHLTDMGKSRAHRAAQAFFEKGFARGEGSILLTGGYSKAFGEMPPIGREAHLMAEFLLGQYDRISPHHLLIEDESTTTEENFLFSLQRFPEFFEGTANQGDRKLALVSQPDHLKTAVTIGSWALRCTVGHFAQQETFGPLEEKTAKVIVLPAPVPLIDTYYMSAAADE